MISIIKKVHRSVEKFGELQHMIMGGKVSIIFIAKLRGMFQNIAYPLFCNGIYHITKKDKKSYNIFEIFYL